MSKKPQRSLAIVFGMMLAIQTVAQAFDRVNLNLIEAESGDTAIHLIGDSSRILGIDYGGDGTIDDYHDIRDGELEIDCSQVPGICISVTGPVGTGSGELDLKFLNHEEAQIHGTIDGAVELTLIGDGTTLLTEVLALSAEISVADGQLLLVNGAAIQRQMQISWFVFNRLAPSLPLSNVVLDQVRCENMIADHQYGQNDESLTVSNTRVRETLLVESRHPMAIEVQDSSCRNLDLSDRGSAGTWNILLGMEVRNSTVIAIAQRSSVIMLDESSDMGRSTRIDTGAGSTTLACEGNFRGNLQISCGSIFDTVILGNTKEASTTVAGDVEITNGGNRMLDTDREREWIDISNIEIANSLRVETGQSVDGVLVSDATVVGTTSIDTASGNDRVELYDSIFVSDVELNGDAGRDDQGEENGNLFLGNLTAKDFESGNLR